MKIISVLTVSFILICSFINRDAKNTGDAFLFSGKENGAGGSRKDVIRLYPNPTFDGTITVSTTLNDTLHFYIFDLEGTLIHQTMLNNKQKKTVTNLKKGTYMYDVFQNDESIDEGKILVK